MVGVLDSSVLFSVFITPQRIALYLKIPQSRSTRALWGHKEAQTPRSYYSEQMSALRAFHTVLGCTHHGEGSVPPSVLMQRCS